MWLLFGVLWVFFTKVAHVNSSTNPGERFYGVQLLGAENRFDISRARHELGFAPQVNLVDGVRRSIAWYRPTCCAPSAQEH